MIRFVSERRHPSALGRLRPTPARGWAPTCRAQAKPSTAKRCVRRRRN